MGPHETIRITWEEMLSLTTGILERHGFDSERARQCAKIFSDNTFEGVPSHGVNRFKKFIDYVKAGLILPGESPTLVHRAGSLEQWDGKLGPGPLNAVFATERAIALAGENGCGLVALANTNHWMRAGTYGWLAADKGCAFIGWTNSEANMPAWGAKDARLGNNPLVFAIPFDDQAVVFDFAMSQYSYGKMDIYRMKGEKLPFPGGYDSEGKMSTDPYSVMKSKRTLPIGYWKGAGLALILDIFATVLSGGLSTAQVTARGSEHGLSQVFIAINLSRLSNTSAISNTINNIISDYKDSIPLDPGTKIRYPGEYISQLRNKNFADGYQVSVKVWDAIRAL